MYKYFTINASKFTKKIYIVFRNTFFKKKNRIFVHKTVSKGNKPASAPARAVSEKTYCYAIKTTKR